MKNYLLAAMLLSPFLSSAQSVTEVPSLGKGTIQIGLVESVGFNNKSGGFIRTTPYIQYFLSDKWAIQLEGRYDFYGPTSNEVDRYLGAGLTTRYYFLNTKKLSLYGQLGYFYGVRPYYTYEKVALGPAITGLDTKTTYPTQGMLNLGVGAQYSISPRWSINAQVEKNFNKDGNAGWNGTLGVGFRIK